MKQPEDYLHLDEVDYAELMNVLLHYFHHSKNISSGVYRFQEKEQPDFVDVHANVDDGKIQKVVLSKDFPEEKLKEIEQAIKDKLLAQSIMVGQDIIFCNEKMAGYFRYKDEFQILPVPDGSPLPKIGFGGHPFLIEFKYNSSTDSMIDWSRRREKATIYTRVLNLLLNQHLQLNGTMGRNHWVLDIEEGTSNFSYSYKQAGYAPEGWKGKHDEFSDTSGLSEMTRVAFQEYYTNPLGVTSDPLRIPDNLEASLDVAFGLSENDWDRFYMSCSWYYQSIEIWHESESSAFISLVTALECLVGERGKCKCCNQEVPDKLDFCECCKQPRYQVTKGFREFLEKFFPFIENFPNEKRTLYGIRSKLAHGIDLFQRDLKPWTFSMNVKHDEQNALHRNLHFISGVTIYKWLWSRKAKSK